MLDPVIEWLGNNEGPLAYLVLALAAMIEYLFPPFPGDLLALAGVALALSAGFDIAGVYVALTLGSVLGAYLVYLFGRRLGDEPENWPAFLRGARTTRAIQRALRGFDRWGTPLLLVNRFFPVLRAVFFVAAGMARLPALRVVVFASVSAAAWNALILGAGYLVGGNLNELANLLEKYTMVAMTFVVIAIAIWVARARRSSPDT